jgi:hypothetical protein
MRRRHGSVDDVFCGIRLLMAAIRRSHLEKNNE